MELRSARIVAGVTIAVFGLMWAVFAGGRPIAGCIGPLNVTEVRCLAATGLRPPPGVFLQLALIGVAAGILVAVPRAWSRWDIVVAVAGFGAGVAVSLAQPPIVLEGPNYDGTLLSITLPIDRWYVFMAGIAGALVALALASIIAVRAPRRRAPR